MLQPPLRLAHLNGPFKADIAAAGAHSHSKGAAGHNPVVATLVPDGKVALAQVESSGGGCTRLKGKLVKAAQLLGWRAGRGWVNEVELGDLGASNGAAVGDGGGDGGDLVKEVLWATRDNGGRGGTGGDGSVDVESIVGKVCVG
jgi:hypothetical protein